MNLLLAPSLLVLLATPYYSQSFCARVPLPLPVASRSFEPLSLAALDDAPPPSLDGPDHGGSAAAWYFASYRHRQEATAGVGRCWLFRALSPSDIEGIVEKMRLVSVPEGDIIVAQGDEVDDSDVMFFVESGKFECFNRDTGDIYMTYDKRWEHFGEEALIFNQPRTASIVAKEDSVVWTLRSDDFLSEISSSPLFPIAREMMLKKYQVNRLQDTVASISVQELLDLLRARMRPKGRPVSLHSTIATLAIGAWGCFLLSIWRPGTDEFGLPMLFDIDHCTNVLPNRVVGFLLATTSVLGMFRIPKRAPVCRKNMFSLMAWVSCLGWAIADSNLGGLRSGYTFDAWAFPGNAIIIGLVVGTVASMLVIIDDSIAGPMVGKETVPLQTPRPLAVGSVFAMSLIIMFPVLLSVPVFGSRELYETMMAPFYREDGFTGTITNSCVSFEGLVGLTGLFMTLLHTKRMGYKAASWIFSAATLTTQYDGMRLAIALAISNFSGDSRILDRAAPHFQQSLDGTSRVLSDAHLSGIFFTALLITVANAVWKLYQTSSPSLQLSPISNLNNSTVVDCSRKMEPERQMVFNATTLSGIHTIYVEHC